MAQEFNIVGNLLLKVDGAEAGLNKLKNSLSKLEMPKGLENSFKKSFSNLDDIFARYRKQLEKGFDSKADVSNITKIGKELDSELTKISNHFTKLTGEKIDFKIDTAPVQQAKKDLEEVLEKRRQLVQEKLEFKIESPKEGIDNIKQLLQEFQRVTGDTKAGRAAGNALLQLETGDIEKAISFLREAENNLTRIGDKKKETFSSTGFTFGGALETIIKELSVTEGELGVVNDKAKLFKDILAQAQTGQLKDVDALLEKIGQGLTKNAGSAREAAKAAQDYAQSTVSMKDQVKQLQQSTQYFFGLRNMLNLFKRGIKEAVDTVKQLDAAMTETAVVTDFSVGDMWAKLPEYTANANALGATVQDMYESTTLYYQQGLDTQQAMGIAAETMKMARIAGLEAADATDMMTAALRGFNMELNEASATRINDVYSNLAAKTASDTEEIGKAMQRTASIAHSAGMSFEGTAAFLAQAIETTREPAENIGTAMKTIVARFQEMKKNPLEISDVEGEEVSFNKVDDALKTIGVDLKDTNGQFRDLDKVFLDISQKWDGLSQTQQRYIATVAAGSRQQSRFIAMMGDYNRTMELMGYANNSSGASALQFNKTLDSLEAKINKFQNAWKQFLMGIMNDSWTKRVVDAGTSVLNVVNKIIDTLSFGGKLKGVKSILSTLTAFTSLKMAGRGANALIGGLGGLVDPRSSAIAGMRQGALGGRQAANAAQAQMIYQPIVNELRAIRQLQGQQLTHENQERLGAYDQYNKFKDSRAFLTGLTKGGKAFSLQDIQQSLFGLDANSQNILMRGNAGTAYTLTRGILGNYAGKSGYNTNVAAGIKNAERFWNTQRASGGKTWEEYFSAISDPKLLKQGIDKTIGNGKYNPAYEYLDNLDKQISLAASQKTSSSEVMRAFKARYKELEEQEVEDIGAQLRKENWAGKIKTENQKQRQKIIQEDNGSFQNSNAAKVLNTIGQVGSGFSQVGMGLQAFGSILTSSANPALQMFGTALTSIGGLISGIGMGISALSVGFTAIAKSSIMTAAESALASTALGSLGITAGMLTGILGVLVAAIAGAAFLIKKQRDNIKKDAEEVTTKYKDKSSENQSNIANLKQWKSELAVLSKGVDENGYNINLDPSEYDHYLEIVDSIAKMNPEIVQGYNAQGHAIIDNNKALEQTLALEKQHSKEILEDYTSSDSLTKLLKARNLERNRNAGGGWGDNYIETIEYELKPRTDMRHEVSKIGSELRRNKDLIDLSKLGIDIDSLASGSEAEFQKVLNNWDLFKRLVSESIDRAGDEWSDQSREAIEESFSAFEEYGSQLDELIQPTYEALSASISKTAGFQEMADNLKAPMQKALKELATNGKFEDGKDIDAAAKNMATKFAGYSEIYIGAMDKVEEANKQFSLDFDEGNYKELTEDAISELEKLKGTLEDTPEGHAISQWIDSEIEKIQKHLSTGTKSIEEAWDTFSDNIATAESALDGFKNATEKDFYSAANDMREIFDTVMDEDAYHTIGYGDNTFWAGAENLLGQNNLIDKSKEEVLGMMKALEPFLKEGPEGVQNFANKVADLAPELEKIAGVEMEDGWFKSIDENINPDVWAQIAEYMGMSESFLVSMVNASRQYKQWDFSDMPAVREAYAIDETVIHGTKKADVTTTDASGKETTVKADTLYITDAELRSRMGSDYYQKSERDNKTEQLRKQGIEVLPEHLKELSANMMKTEMGIANWQEAIKTFGDTGVFDKSEIYDAAKTLAMEEQGKNFDEETFRKQFNEGWTAWLDSYNDPTLDTLNTIASDVSGIAAKYTGESAVDKKEKDTKEKDKKSSDKQGSTTEPGQTGSSKPKGTDTGAGAKRDVKDEGRNWLQKLNDWYVKGQKNAEKNVNGANSGAEERTQKQHDFYTQLTSGIKQAIADRKNTEEAYKGVQGKSAEETQKQSKEWWSNAWNWFIGKDSSTTDSNQVGSTDTNVNPSDTIAQLSASIEPLTAAGESLNTAASSLTSAAEALSGSGQDKNINPSSTNSEVPSIEVIATIKEVMPPAEEPTIPVKANLEVEGNTNGGGFFSKLFGGKKEGPSIDVAANVTSIKTGEQPQTISVVGNLTELKNTATINNINATATVTKVTKSAQVAGEPIQVKATATTTKVENKQPTQKVSAGTQTMNVTANTSAAQAKINQLISLFNKTYTLKYKASGPTSIKVPISANFIGSWRKTVEISKSGANGINNKGYGSLAKGSRYGTIGPNGRGGLTLTGEKGFEVAWLPSENRSMILGKNGPQMLNLPSDAVVWNHEQSKKILKQKSIPAGSQATATSSGGWNFSGWGGGNSSGGGGSSTAKAVTKAAKHVKKKADEAAAAVQKVSVWWENIARKTEVAQRQQDKSQKAFEKYLKEMRATLRTTGQSLSVGGGGGDDYLTNIGKTLGYYEAQLEKVNKELNNLTNGTAPKEQKKRKEKYGEEGYENIAKISYKSGKKSKEELVDLAKYIKEEDGTFVVDQAELDKVKSKDQRKAIADAANKEINDRLSKKYKAEDEIEKAQEAITKFGEELYNTFFKWEVELTKIWNITQKIEQTEARISQFKGYSDLLESQLSTGMAKAGSDFAKQSLSAFKAGLEQQTKQISLSFDALGQKKTDLNKLIDLEDEKETLLKIQDKLVNNIGEQNNVAKLQEKLASKQEALNQATSKRESLEKREDTIDSDIASTNKKTKSKKKKTRNAAKKKLKTLNKEKDSLPTELANARATEAAATADYEAAKKAYESAKNDVALNDTERIGYEEYAKQLEDNIAMQAEAWKYMTVNQLSDGSLDVNFNTEAFEAEKFAGNISEERGKQIQDYVKSIVDGSKELSQQYTDTTSLINDMYGSLQTLQDAWANYADELWDISEAEQRKEVDNTKKLSDSLTNSLKDLLDEVKRKLDERRKQEDNAKTERDISQKQQRLAALRADTSGGHQVEIAQLQQEIADAQQSYQRSLEDQLLDRLQQQADLAAQQREQQIALQEATISAVNNAALVNQWMNDPVTYKDAILEAFKTANDYDKKPEALQQQLDNKFETLFNGLLTNQEEQALVTENISLLEGKTEEIRAELEQFTALKGAIDQLTSTLSQLSGSNTAQEVNKPTGLTAEQTTAGRIEAAQKAANASTTSTESTVAEDPTKKAYEEAIAAAHKKKSIDKDTFADAVRKGKAIGYDEAHVAKDLAEGDGKGGVTWEEVVKAAKKAGYKKDKIAKWSTDKYLAKAIKKWKQYKYETGGLANYTGPAWLDGTPSKPELVLNSTDTKNFLALRDVLSSAMSSIDTTSNSYGGDTMYEININVDHLNNDYDVDKVVEKVKKEITKGAGYRNVTQVRNFR